MYDYIFTLYNDKINYSKRVKLGLMGQLLKYLKANELRLG